MGVLFSIVEASLVVGISCIIQWCSKTGFTDLGFLQVILLVGLPVALVTLIFFHIMEFIIDKQLSFWLIRTQQFILDYLSVDTLPLEKKKAILAEAMRIKESIAQVEEK